MKFILNADQYALLKTIDFSEIGDSVNLDDSTLSVSIKDDQIRTFQVIISEEIDRRGLSDDQNTVLPLGRKLYALYDEIYAQIHSN